MGDLETKMEVRLTKNGKRSEWRHKTIEQHIEESVFPCPNTGCWWWAGTIDKETGYGQYSMDHKTVRAHRGMFEHFTGIKLTPENILCHKCDNPLCVNPDHLFIGTPADNVADMVSKDRHRKGINHPRRKLTEKEVLEIREYKRQGYTDRELGKRYGVDKTTISLIKRRKLWAHLDG